MKDKSYRIPVMSIQGTLLDGVENDKRYIHLTNWLLVEAVKNEENWGLGVSKGNGHSYEVSFKLEHRWFPVFTISNQWLADSFVRYLAEYKPWEKESE